MDNRQFYTTAEVATKLRVSKAHIYTLVKQGKLPSVKIGKRIVFTDTVFDILQPKVEEVPQIDVEKNKFDGSVALFFNVREEIKLKLFAWCRQKNISPGAFLYRAFWSEAKKVGMELEGERR